MSIVDDDDVEALIALLAGPLSRQDRVAFRQAAKDATRPSRVLGRGGRLSGGRHLAAAILRSAILHPRPVGYRRAAEQA